MRVNAMVLLAAAFGLAACADTAAPSQAAKADDPQGICQIDAHDMYFRADTSWPVTYTVKNANRWCFKGVTLSGPWGSGSSANLTEPPTHGEVRIITRAQGIFMGYRPAPGYTGSDRFVVSLWGAGGFRIAYTASVIVLPPPSDTHAASPAVRGNLPSISEE
jgi:hypothetical protein